MKIITLKTIALIAISLVLSTAAIAQSTNKELKKDLRSKIDRDCKKTAKKLTKEGWEVMPGKLSLERQIQNSRYAELAVMEDNKRQYFTATHSATGGNYSAAKKMVSSRALTELAEQVSSTITSIVDNNISNMNFGDNDLEIIDKCVSASKHTVASKLNGAIAVLDIFRQNNNNCEVRVMYKLDVQNSILLAKNIYKEELKKESAELATKLDQLIK